MLGGGRTSRWLSISRHTSFYGRPLPDHSLSFSSTEGKKVFVEALHAGYLEAYFPLAAQFITQNEPAFCGLGSLTMVLNALRVDPGPERRVWRGSSAWRWFEEENLSLYKGLELETVRTSGINLDEFKVIAEENGAECDMHRPAGPKGLEQFRKHVQAATSQQFETSGLLVVSFCRQTLGQTGSGHFSPVGAYHPASDRVLVMDVARFKYPPYWCPLSLLYEAMHPLDRVTQEPRGYFKVRAGLLCPVWGAWQREQHLEAWRS